MTDLLILFASQTGNAEMVAQDVFVAAQGFAIEAKCVGMEKISPADLAAARDVLLVVSTCGDGDMPDNALALWQAMQSADAPALPNLHYAVLALGDMLYDYFCQAGKDWDARLEALGATRLLPRVDCDVEFGEDAAAWTQNVLHLLAEKRAWAVREIMPPPVIHTEPGYSRDEPLNATLLARHTLTGTEAVREVLHCELDLGQNVRWQAGALLYVYPENDAEIVAQVIDVLGARPADQMYWQGKRERLDILLRQQVELRKPSAELLAALSITAQTGDDVLDCLRARPILDAQDALEYLRPLAPRAYSIANAQHGDNIVHLTLTRIAYTRHERRYHGAATHYLARLPIGGNLRCYLAVNRYFAVPDNPERDLIMIATGSGIAPFRAFLQTRALQKAGGRNWLIFGNRNRAQDFLYGHELHAWHDQGLLHHLSPAFSRDQAAKIYVQDVLREHGAELFAWLENGAYVMVCGSADPMAVEVEAALLEVIEKHGNMRAANAAEYIARLKNDKRYVRDVY